jgi:hypothetical protein
VDRVCHLVGLEHGELQQLVGWDGRQCGVLAAVRAPSRWPDCDAMTTPAPPRAMTLPNSSSTSAVPYKSTARMVAGEGGKVLTAKQRDGAHERVIAEATAWAICV